MRSPPRVIPDDPHLHLDLATPLGRGGTGTVWKARLSRPDGASREVAAKVSHGTAAPEAQRRLRELAWKLDLVRHPALVPIESFLSLRDSRWALLTAYIPGVDLAHLRSVGPVPLGAAIVIASEVADVLHAALRSVDTSGGALALIHRDLKPSNVMLGPTGEVHVLDFGVSHAQVPWSESGTCESRVWGTLAYMAPERLGGDEGAAGDVYALGVMLLELVTGTTFGTTSTRRAEHDERVGAALVGFAAVGTPRLLFALVASMLAFDAKERPSMSVVAESLGRLRTQQGDAALADWAPGAVAEARHRAAPLRLPLQARRRARARAADVMRPAPRRLEIPPMRRIIALLVAGALLVLATDRVLRRLTDDVDARTGTFLAVAGPNGR